MKRSVLPGLNGELVDVTRPPRWTLLLIRHNIPWRLLNKIALHLRALWDPDAREVLRSHH